jgi:hypothetical protein
MENNPLPIHFIQYEFNIKKLGKVIARGKETNAKCGILSQFRNNFFGTCCVPHVCAYKFLTCKKCDGKDDEYDEGKCILRSTWYLPLV